jgi:hypothetical protein
MQLLSDAFEEGQHLLMQYTKDGDNISPRTVATAMSGHVLAQAELSVIHERQE